MFVVYLSPFFYSLVYINGYHFITLKIWPRPLKQKKKKKKMNQEKITSFTTRPVSWILDQAVPQIQQNMAP